MAKVGAEDSIMMKLDLPIVIVKEAIIVILIVLSHKHARNLLIWTENVLRELIFEERDIFEQILIQQGLNELKLSVRLMELLPRKPMHVKEDF